MSGTDERPRVLVVEDDAAILRGLEDRLTQEGYEVLTAADGPTGLERLREDEPDLVVLDLMLPGLSGYEICRTAREEGMDLPILMLTARGEETDRVLGLDLGADDYVTKPFSIRELLARIRAHLRRERRGDGGAPDELRLGDAVVDFRGFEAHKAGRLLSLTRKEFALLRHLAGKPGEAVSRGELLRDIWGYERMPTTRTVDNHVAQLRSKLEDDPANPRYLRTVHGVGYKLVP